MSAEASVDRRRPAARQPHADLRRQPDLDRGRHRHRARRGRRRALRGLRLARADRRLDPRRRRRTPRTSPRSTTRSAKAEAVTDRPSFIVLRTIIAWPAPERPEHRQGATAPPSATTRSRPPRRCSASTPTQTFEVPADVLAHTREAVDARQGGAGRVGRGASRHWTTEAVRRRGALRPDADPHPARRLGRRRCRRSRPTPKGVATRKASGKVINAIAAGAARAVGRLGRPRRAPTTPPSRASPSFLPEDRSTKMCTGDPLRRPGAALRHPRARHGRDHERHRRARRHPRLRRHLPHVLRLHAPARCGSPR